MGVFQNRGLVRVARLDAVDMDLAEEIHAAALDLEAVRKVIEDRTRSDVAHAIGWLLHHETLGVAQAAQIATHLDYPAVTREVARAIDIQRAHYEHLIPWVRLMREHQVREASRFLSQQYPPRITH